MFFLEWISRERVAGSERNRVTVVFDGHGPRVKGAGSGSVEGIFSGDQDADTVIREVVAALKNPRIAVVVTNDKSIRLSVRRKGAQTLSCEEFLAMGQRKSKPRRSDALDEANTQEIDNELKRIWKL